MVQPSEGLVVSLPVLVDAQCLEKLPREAHVAFLRELDDEKNPTQVANLRSLLANVLNLGPDRFDEEDELPKDVALYVPEGRQMLRPTRALKRATAPDVAAPSADATPASIAARPYAMLVWEVPPEVDTLDRPETVTGPWAYPAHAKFERLLRECRVPIGLLSNGRELRLVYAPHGESSGWLAFRVPDMGSVSGRPIFDAFVMLLSRKRWFGVAPEQQLPAILAESRKRNADVTNDLSRQVFEALEALLAGFSAADERDGKALLRQALERGDEHLYAGLLTVLLRLVFLLYCEDRTLLPVEKPLFAENYSLLGLFDQLQSDYGRYPDTMHRRFGAYPRLVALFRAVFLGISHRELEIPARRGELFNPNVYPFLEGWGPEGAAPITEAEARAAVQVPSVDDLTVYTVLEKLLYLGGQRLSYKALDVEQIGSVYEALMGFDVERLTNGAVRIRLGSKKGAARVWVEAERLLQVPKAQRQRFLQDELGFDKNVAAKIVEGVASAKNSADALAALEPLSGRRTERAAACALVIQPGPERRRTSSHYTPRELTEPIVARTLDPLIKAIGEEPSSEALLNLVICDPAMGSGAFLVAACRYLADHLVAAWTREGRMEKIADAHEDVVNHARRLVAQRCLYGVDKNKYAVQLARLSLWLVTMARNEPFTFVDHALRHGDSLVGLDFDQIRAFHWRPGPQVELSAQLLKDALDEAIGIRKRILELAEDGTYAAQREKERLLFDAEDALDRVRLVADLVIGAFFAKAKDKEREAERSARLNKVAHWLSADSAGERERADTLRSELAELQRELRRTQVPFHWMLEFPEVFYAERPDPLDGSRVNGAAHVEAFVGNPPFSGKNGISAAGGPFYIDWLMMVRPEVQGRPNTDLCAYFFRQAADLIGLHGSIGLVATNTIAEGDSRLVGLCPVVERGAIYSAVSDLTWPGDAAVHVSVVHVALGRVLTSAPSRLLDGREVKEINTRLLPRREQAEQVRLAANAGISFMGGKLVGVGLAVSLEEHAALVRADPRNAEILRPYLGGEEVNSNVLGKFERYMIDFTSYTLKQAAQWPLLLRIAEEKVRPARDRDKRGTYKTYWWRPGESGGALYRALDGLPRCLVASRHTKHLALAFHDTRIFFSEGLYVFALERWSAFAVLQSRIHAPWARLLSSSMKSDLRYAASDCFETFPFPQANPRTLIPKLESVGERLYNARATYMVDMNQGLTKTYNAIKDPACDDPRVRELRRLHEEMDRAVIETYGWSNLDVPTYCPRTETERVAVKAFEDAVIERLFALNAERANEERRLLATAPMTSKKRAPKQARSGRGSKSTKEQDVLINDLEGGT
jgi:hypothetical protein